MRCLVINPEDKSVKELQHNGDYKEIYQLIGNGCEIFQIPFSVSKDGAHRDDFYCDEGWYIKKREKKMPLTVIDGFHSPLAGRIVVLGTDIEGNACSAKITIEELKKRITFINHTIQ